MTSKIVLYLIHNTKGENVMGIIEEVGFRIKKRRQQLDVTLKQVAENIGVQEATVQRYESGTIKNIPYEKIVLLSDALKCSPSYLMGWEDNSNDETEDIIVDILSDNRLLEYTKKLNLLSENKKEKVYSYIDCMYEMES